MNYEQSLNIFEKIKKAKKILINCHYKPDPDGIGSALAIYLALKKIGDFEIELICPSKPPESLNYLPNFEKIKQVKYSEFDFSKYNLWIIPDAANWWQISGILDFNSPKIDVVNFDHHETNEVGFENSIISKGLSSAAELIFNVFEDWDLKLDRDIATCILSGIIGDTGVFRYTNVTSKTLEIGKKLMDLGADKNMIVARTYGSIPFSEMKFWGRILDLMRLEEDYNFVWVGVSLEEYEKYGRPVEAKSAGASNFASIVDGTDFGIVIVEEKKDFVTCSFRSRGNFDISKIATELGGGGHKEAAGARIVGFSFDEAVKKVLDVARKYAKKTS
ncbi:MAG: DHH family phosphoesterase [Patescibacteria group bacterium]